MAHCDKCHQPVELKNDAVALEMVRQHGVLPGLLETLNYGSRHLLPVDGCEGSPSRAQYLEGQPRDTRGYKYYPEDELCMRDAYGKLQQLVAAIPKGDHAILEVLDEPA